MLTSIFTPWAQRFSARLSDAPIAHEKPEAAPTFVPIRAIGPRERAIVGEHLLALSQRDRYLRFGYMATDEQVMKYADGIDFDRDEIFGIFNRRLELIAMAHLALPATDGPRTGAEFGVSVNEKARGRGFGAQLFARAVVVARNEGVKSLYIHALSENAAMLKIARKGGATVVRDGSEAEAHLELPAATLDSRMSELALQHFADIDYSMKAQAKTFWSMVDQAQAIRRGVQDARKLSSP